MTAATSSAYRWLLARKPFIVPIPGTRDSAHLNENLGALHIALAAADLTELETSLASITVHGGRMNAMQVQMVDGTAWARGRETGVGWKPRDIRASAGSRQGDPGAHECPRMSLCLLPRSVRAAQHAPKVLVLSQHSEVAW